MISRRALVLLLPLALGACETFDGLKKDAGSLWDQIQSSTVAGKTREVDSLAAPIAANCPSITMMPELKHLAEFSDPAKPSDKTLVSEFTMVGVQSECAQHATAMAMQIDVLFTGRLGPKAKVKATDKPNFAYPYFIAVTDLSGKVVAKEIFAASVAYDASQTETKQIETITQQLPVTKEEDVRNYTVLVGFQLDDSQLAYNRARQK